MGMFTSVAHPETGEEVQFKTGIDDCDWVTLGEEVPWQIWPDMPGRGKLLDGVYWGTDKYPPTTEYADFPAKDQGTLL
jgi:hypothetical protein